MGMNAKEYAQRHGVTAYMVRSWYEAGYLHGAVREEKTGHYDIPEDTPCPHKAKSSIKSISKLWADILDAADLQRAVFPGMYPKVAPGTLERQVQQLAEAGLIRIQTTPGGAEFLELTLSGQQFRSSLTEKEQQRILDKILKLMGTGVEICAAFSTVYPLLQPLLPLG